jgi:hypothetical protein
VPHGGMLLQNVKITDLVVTIPVVDDRGVGVRFPVGARILSSQVVQTGSGVHPTSYPIDTGCSFSGGKAAGA